MASKGQKFMNYTEEEKNEIINKYKSSPHVKDNLKKGIIISFNIGYDSVGGTTQSKVTVQGQLLCVINYYDY